MGLFWIQISCKLHVRLTCEPYNYIKVCSPSGLGYISTDTSSMSMQCKALNRNLISGTLLGYVFETVATCFIAFYIDTSCLQWTSM